MIAPGQLTTIARELVAQGTSKQRVRTLWAVAKFAARSAAADHLNEILLQLAVDTNLIDGDGYWVGADIAIHRRPFGRTDIQHILRAAERGWNPFESGSSHDRR
jgi:hypothetical protein